MNRPPKLTVISARRPPLWAWLRGVGAAHRLLRTLALRDLRIQYAQTALGLLWTAGQPLVGLLVFTLFFGRLVQVEVPGGLPYPLYAFTGMLGWFLFTYIVTRGGLSLVSNQELISRVEFPRLVLPLSKVLTGLVEAGVSLVLLLGLMLILGHPPGWRALLTPVFVLGVVAIGLSIALWLAALTLRYRDLQHIVPYLVNLAIWLTPVFYPSSLIPPDYRFFLYLNPMTAMLEGLRWCLLGGEVPSVWYVLSAVPVVVLLVGGVWYFRWVEGRISDEV
jgi:lipopolysaccharide transport system permease protein